jgi:hypothetical protein
VARRADSRAGADDAHLDLPICVNINATCGLILRSDILSAFRDARVLGGEAYHQQHLCLPQ